MLQYPCVREAPIPLPLNELAVDMVGALEKRFWHADAIEPGQIMDVQITESRIAIEGGCTRSYISDFYIRVSEKVFSINFTIVCWYAISLLVPLEMQS